MKESEPEIDQILSLQHPDGGWGYQARSVTWTEPTAYALLALASADLRSSRAFTQGLARLESLEREDGGWAPSAQVRESTWVTALAVLAFAAAGKRTASGEAWLIESTPANTRWAYRLRAWLGGGRSGEHYRGWPWYPETAAWVTPTALSILALGQMVQANSGAVQERIHEGRDFLLEHTCADGGWNHGSESALGYASRSYPETTGLALLALRPLRNPEVGRAVEFARASLAACRSSEGASWLQLGLRAHGHPVASPSSPLPCRGIVALALSALARGRNVFV